MSPPESFEEKTSDFDSFEHRHRGLDQIQYHLQQESRQTLEHQMVAEGAKLDEYVRRFHAETREIQKRKLKLMDVIKEFEEKFWLDEAPDDPFPELGDTDADYE
jgi:hypothetical protein